MTIKKESNESLAIARDLLLKNETIIIPTDTVYGLSAIVNKENKSKISEIKKRQANKHLIYLIEKPLDALRYVDCSFYSKDELDHLTSCWPSPLTIIFKAIGEPTIALRCPNDTWLQELIKSVDSPIFSTSANLSGSKTITDVKMIEEVFNLLVPLIVDGGYIGEVASTILDASRRPFKVVREGSYTYKEKEV